MDKDQADKIRLILGEDGTVGFSIRTQNIPERVAVLEDFRLLCHNEFRNDYTLGIKFLMHAFKSDFKYESLNERINYLKEEIDDLKIKLENLTAKPKNEDDKNVAF